MSKSNRIKKLKIEQAQKADLIQDGIRFLEKSDLKADLFIVTIPGVGSVNVTDYSKLRRLAS